MNVIAEMLAERSPGEIRVSVVVDYSGNLSIILQKFGLKPDVSELTERDRDCAVSILTNLLWKDQAYGCERMQEDRARFFAEKIIEENECKNSRYFSNGSSIIQGSWYPFTDSTFDSGIVMSNGDGRYFCMWFEGED
ncbi:hypothetical protein [Paraburkholderia ferrariae]|uniref:hypothetical protein n=1 Tax=Paraburkholderia ferrariae TaxID=386056 RepID=UPI0012ECA313|nr:hypothetical protein [Paraburkholderia ferrariae]